MPRSARRGHWAAVRPLRVAGRARCLPHLSRHLGLQVLLQACHQARARTSLRQTLVRPSPTTATTILLTIPTTIAETMRLRPFTRGETTILVTRALSLQPLKDRHSRVPSRALDERVRLTRMKRRGSRMLRWAAAAAIWIHSMGMRRSRGLLPMRREGEECWMMTISHQSPSLVRAVVARLAVRPDCLTQCSQAELATRRAPS
jgi:hypothetical protein